MSSLLSGALIMENMAAGHQTDLTRCLKVSHSFVFVRYFLIIICVIFDHFQGLGTISKLLKNFD